MSDIDKRLNELMEFDVWCMCGADECLLAQNFKEAKQAIKQLMADEFEKMIGEDDKYDALTIDSDYDYAARNQLRKELRQKLEEWKK